MSLSKMSRRSLVAAMAAVPFGVSSHSATQAQGGYRFRSSSGAIVLSDVRLALWDPGDGDYVAKITVAPTQEEINALLHSGSHVDFKVSFLGLAQSGERADFSVAVSDYVRIVGATVDSQHADPIFRALGLNIEKRWIAGEAITITASIYGYQPYSEFRPGVSVELVSSYWWFAEDDSYAAYEREKNGVVERFGTEQGARSSLIDSYGDVRFPF